MSPESGYMEGSHSTWPCPQGVLNLTDLMTVPAPPVQCSVCTVSLGLQISPVGSCLQVHFTGVQTDSKRLHIKTELKFDPKSVQFQAAFSPRKGR